MLLAQETWFIFGIINSFHSQNHYQLNEKLYNYLDKKYFCPKGKNARNLNIPQSTDEKGDIKVAAILSAKYKLIHFFFF